MKERMREGTCSHCGYSCGTHSEKCVMVVDDNRTKIIISREGILVEKKAEKGVFNENPW